VFDADLKETTRDVSGGQYSSRRISGFSFHNAKRLGYLNQRTNRNCTGTTVITSYQSRPCPNAPITAHTTAGPESPVNVAHHEVAIVVDSSIKRALKTPFEYGHARPEPSLVQRVRNWRNQKTSNQPCTVC